jgi:hypothetical protein
MLCQTSYPLSLRTERNRAQLSEVSKPWWREGGREGGNEGRERVMRCLSQIIYASNVPPSSLHSSLPPSLPPSPPHFPKPGKQEGRPWTARAHTDEGRRPNGGQLCRACPVMGVNEGYQISKSPSLPLPAFSLSLPPSLPPSLPSCYSACKVDRGEKASRRRHHACPNQLLTRTR